MAWRTIRGGRPLPGVFDEELIRDIEEQEFPTMAELVHGNDEEDFADADLYKAFSTAKLIHDNEDHFIDADQ